MPQPTDLGVLKQMAPVAKGQLEKVGIKVDVQPMDWRLMAPNLIATCEKARSGWPCDVHLEALRDKFTQASTEAEKKAAAEEVQAYAMQVVTHIPLGEWHGLGAARDNIGYPSPLPPISVFWGVTKK